MKRTIKATLCAVLLALMCFTLTSCYVSHPTAMRNLTGTYELTKFTRKAKDADSEADPDDYIAQKGIVAYLVITGEDYGYYVYKDNETPVTVKQVKILYEYDSEDISKVKSITYNDGVYENGTKYPGAGSELLGVNFRLFKRELNYSFQAVLGNKFAQSVIYKKANKATDLKYVEKKLGSLPAVVDYPTQPTE